MSTAQTPEARGHSCSIWVLMDPSTGSSKELQRPSWSHRATGTLEVLGIVNLYLSLL